MNEAVRDAILAYTDTHSGTEGLYRTCVSDLAVIRGDRRTSLEHAFYESALIVVVQGSKELQLGNTRFIYRAGEFLILSIGLPVLASITSASDDRPYLALALTIDLRLINDLLDELGRVQGMTRLSAPSRFGLIVGTIDEQQADALTRLAMLLAKPDALRILYSSIAREIFYWTLTGPAGAEIRRLATPDSHAQRIASAIAVLRAEFAQGISIERLAEIAHMSASSFHHHFKVITSMSPLQYQKQLRLLQARRLMFADGADASRAAYEVGYESASQFSREYARMFGAPPRRDVVGFRSAAS